MTMPDQTWTAPQWKARRAANLARVQPLADAFVQRRSLGEKHPVHDFLFTYYTFSPAKLKQWLPPLGVRIEVSAADLAEMPWLLAVPVIQEDGVLQLDDRAIPPQRRDLARWVATLCGNIQNRAPRFGCYGLHEWAMVYKQSREQVRHQGNELRLSPAELAVFVESQPIGCSHYDAFRYFTPEAKPFNVLQPVLETRLEMEQGACLHANMDLFKWAGKLWPWIGSDLIGECFAHACEGRDLDMRASPYDLRHLGYEPLCIETAGGRHRYEAKQRSLAEKAAGLRERLKLAAARLGGMS
jgi:hypothetical protein